MDHTYLLISLIIIFFAILTIFKIFGKKEIVVENLYPLADYYYPISNETKNPDILEVSLTASEVELEINGIITSVYTYNELYPGPLIKGRVGQKLIIHFKNDLLFPTNLEFYGYSVSDKTSILLDNPVLPGSEISYVLTLNKPGLYMYRSGKTGRDQHEQVSNGLYGVLLVKDDIQNHRLGLPLEENIIVISDIYQDDIIGSEMNHIYLVNGIKEGVIEVERNVTQRLNIINASCDEIYRLSLEDTEMMRIGGDQGLCEEPIYIPVSGSLILTPGERADIIFIPKNDATQLQSNNIPLVTFISIGDKNKDDDDKDDARNNSIKGTVRSRLICIPRITPKDSTPVIDITYFEKEIIVNDGSGNLGITMSSSYDKDGYILTDGTYIFEVYNKTRYTQNFHISELSFQHVLTTSTNNTFTEDNTESNIYSPSVIETQDTIIVLPNSKVILLLKIPKKVRKNKTGMKYYFGSNILFYAKRGLQSYFRVV